MRNWDDFDYVHFDANSYFQCIVMSDNCEDYWSLLQKVSATEENFNSIRDALIHSYGLFEFFTLLVDKCGVERVENDEELMSKVYSTFDKKLVDAVFGKI